MTEQKEERRKGERRTKHLVAWHVESKGTWLKSAQDRRLLNSDRRVSRSDRRMVERRLLHQPPARDYVSTEGWIRTDRRKDDRRPAAPASGTEPKRVFKRGISGHYAEHLSTHVDPPETCGTCARFAPSYASPDTTPAAPTKLREICGICEQECSISTHVCAIKPKLSEREIEIVNALMLAESCDHYCCGLTPRACLAKGVVNYLDRMAPPSPPSEGREQFEKWAVNQGFDIERQSHPFADMYDCASTRAAWEAWQAARASVPAAPEPPLFVKGQRVRGTGFAGVGTVVHDARADKPQRRVAVLVESGNTWLYEPESLTLVRAAAPEEKP